MNQILFSAAFIFCSFILFSNCAPHQNTHNDEPKVNLIPVDYGWARSSVNAVIFRINSIDSYNDLQYVAYYNSEGNVMLARRNLQDTRWDIHTTPYTGDVTNAHNAISIGFDGDGVLHMVWGLHNAPMQYVQIKHADELTFTEPVAMTGLHETSVTYPQFFKLGNGDMLFMYRDGGSGRGNILLNRYFLETKSWHPIQHPLIDGGGELSPYPNPVSIDLDGGWHLTWNWRETPDVSSNHDIAYAYSPDEGETWLTSTGDIYTLPIHAGNAEIIKEIPQNSDLINQTSMAVDSKGNPVIATYWRSDPDEVPQYHIIRYDGEKREWITHQAGKRTLDFSLSGFGTRRIPIARPLVLTADDQRIIMIFRDFERGGGVSAAVGFPPHYSDWNIIDIDTASVGLWEPTHDPAVWKRDQVLHLFHQYVGQGDAETLEDIPVQEISVLEWIP